MMPYGQKPGDSCIVIYADGMDVTVWSASGLSIYAGPISGGKS